MAGIRWWWMALLLLGSWRTASSCSCMTQHPQTQYCQSDFVIVATARRLMKSSVEYENVYKMKIRKEFKMSEKARVALKAGRLITANNEGLCGISLKLNQTYLVTGRVISLQAHVNLCNYVEPWKNVTPRQRKGFRMLYKQGCPCRIQPCMSDGCTKRAKHICRWSNPFSRDNCHSSHGICLINQDGLCHWARAPRLTECLRQKDLQQQTFR